ncbi:MAG: hypothetical protein V7K30_05880 [Nostoc sp.]
MNWYHKRFKYSLDPYPTIRQIYKSCICHPVFIAAQPHLQPDASEYSPEDEY